MEYSFFSLNSLICLQCTIEFLIYIFKWVMKGRIRAISRHREGQESSELDPCQGKLQKDLDFVHIPMYAVLVVNSRIYVLISLKVVCIIFHMFLGMVKETSKDKKWSMVSKESTAGQGKAIQIVIHLE